MESVNDQLQQLSNHDHQPHSLNFNNLLQENISQRHFLFGQTHVGVKEEYRGESGYHDYENKCEFNLRTIEVRMKIRQKQDQIRHIPEQLDRQHQDEEPLDFDLIPKKPSHQEISVQKRLPVINKIAYQSQTRRDKVERYLQKKKRRVWSRKISYNCRKLVADKRERRNGRFVKKQETNCRKFTGSQTKKSSKQTVEGGGRFEDWLKIEDCCQ